MGKSKKSFEIHPFTLISESIRLNLFEDLIDSLHATKNSFDEKYDLENIKNVSSVRIEDDLSHFEGEFLSDEFADLEIEEDTEKIINMCLLDEDRKFLKEYIISSSNLFPDLEDNFEGLNNQYDSLFIDLDPEVLCQVLETFLEKNFIPEKFVTKKNKSHFILNDLRGASELKEKIFYLCVPFAYYLWKPFKNIDNAKKIKGACITCLTKDDPITLNQLKSKLNKIGYSPKVSFLYSLVINDSDFLTITNRKKKEILVDRADEIIPDFDQIGRQHSPGTFFKNPNNDKRTGYAFGKVISKNAVIDKRALKKIIYLNKGEKYFDRLDLEEVAFKLFFHYENNSINRSDLFHDVCEKTIKLIEKEGKLMRWHEIARKLKIPNLPLDPIKLGPGRLMAYAPSKIYLEKRNSAYVLKDFVSTGKIHEPGKIIRDRVITPFKEKNWSFEVSDLFEMLGSDPFIEKYEIVPLNIVARKIAYKLPDMPTEPYYLNLIKKTIFDNLEHMYSRLDPRKNFLVNRSIYSERNKNSWSSWRNECICRALECNRIDLTNTLDRLEETERSIFLEIVN